MDNNNVADQQSTMAGPELFAEAVAAGLFLVPSDRCEVAGDGIVRVVEARCASCTRASCPLRSEMERVRSLKSSAEAAGPATARYEGRRQRLLTAVHDMVELGSTPRYSEVVEAHALHGGWNMVAQWVMEDALSMGMSRRDVCAVMAGVALQVADEIERTHVKDPQERQKLARLRSDRVTMNCGLSMVEMEAFAEKEMRDAARCCVIACANATYGYDDMPREEGLPQWIAAARTYAVRLAEVLRGRREVIDGYVAEFGPILDAKVHSFRFEV